MSDWIDCADGTRGDVIDLDTGLSIPVVTRCNVATGEYEQIDMSSGKAVYDPTTGNLKRVTGKARLRFVPWSAPDTSSPAPQDLKLDMFVAAGQFVWDKVRALYEEPDADTPTIVEG